MGRSYTPKTSPNPVVPSQTPQPVPSSRPGQADETANWKTETVQIRKGTEISGNEVVNLSFQIPPNWTLQTINRSTNSNNLIKNCADYVINSDVKGMALTLSPVCTGWSAKYSPWPKNSQVINIESGVGNDGHTNNIVRYFDENTSKHYYADGDKDSSTIEDVVKISYGRGNFIPLVITSNLATLEESTNAPDRLKIGDQIVISIKTN